MENFYCRTMEVVAKANSKLGCVVFGCGEFDGDAFFFSCEDG